MPIDYLEKRPTAVLDTESYPNLWAIGFRDLATKRVVKLKLEPGGTLDRARIAKIMRNYRVITFNGVAYDMPIIALAMSGATCEDMWNATVDLIKCGLKHWEFYDKYEVTIPSFVDHIDLWHVGPSAAQHASLKRYAGMMHSRFMQELPYAPGTVLDSEQVDNVMDYLDNDLEVTSDMAIELTPQLDIRAKISAKLGVDVRSKSDAQVGEAIMKARVEKRKGNGKRLYKPEIVPGSFKFECPAYINFKTKPMQDMLSRLLRADFYVRRDGYVQLPDIFGKAKKKEVSEDDDDELEGGQDIVLGGNIYKMGIGGLHSKEKAVSAYEDDEYEIWDFDVTGYYPNLILRSGREPDNMRGHFQPVYREIVEERAAAKAAGNKDEAESGKIASNGLFGKQGSPHSIVYTPRGMIQTTVTGQLSLLMLIEEFCERGWQVLSANTDGIVTRVPKNELGMFRSIIFDWEVETGLNMEGTAYRSIHSRSVNDYMAFKKVQDKKGNFTGAIEVKRKGQFAPSGRGVPAALGLKKTPNAEICYDAAVAYVLNGTPVASTINNCQDIRKFVVVRAVKGGAEKDGVYIGKVVRYYYSCHTDTPLLYADNGHRVPKSAGAEPCMRLPEELPDDIDYEWYEREGYAILDECGMEVPDPALRGRDGTYFGHHEKQKTFHFIDAATSVAACGAVRKSRRDPWIEYEKLPEGARYCSKCRKEEL